jgi:predicted Zn-dependent protease
MRRLLAGFALAISMTACGVSTQQEVEMGQQYAAQINQQLPIIQDPELNRYINVLGDSIARLTERQDLPEWHFYIVDSREVNAFAVPGGFVYVNRGLIERTQRMDQLAGVLGHEIGHVVGRHGAEHIAKQQLTEGLTGAAVLATYDPNNPSTQNSAAVAAMIGQLVGMRFGRQDELESDKLGVRFTSEAGYDPRSMTALMKILDESSKGGRPPEFFSTHPNPENRIQRIEVAIKERYPEGVPAGLEK